MRKMKRKIVPNKPINNVYFTIKVLSGEPAPEFFRKIPRVSFLFGTNKIPEWKHQKNEGENGSYSAAGGNSTPSRPAATAILLTPFSSL